jgi:thiol-disulfide isomerase/thioredoxin
MIVLIGALILSTAPPTARWAEGDVDSSLNQGKPVVVVFHASWCEPCNELGKMVLDVESGRALLDEAAGVLVDFETDRGRKLATRFAVISLPTTLILSATGKQLNRVQGFDDASTWLSKVKGALAGNIDVAVLQMGVADAPGDRTLSVKLAEAKLFRGEEDVARTILFREIRVGGTPGLQAGRIWGRYLVRVKGDGVRGAAHFAALAEQFKRRKEVAEFRYWTAQGHHVAGAKVAALAVFDTWTMAEPRNEQASLFKANFMVQFNYEAAATKEAVLATMAVAPEAAYPHYLLAELALRAGDRTGAEASIRRAIAREANNALFENFLTRRLGLKLTP